MTHFLAQMAKMVSMGLVARLIGLATVVLFWAVSLEWILKGQEGAHWHYFRAGNGSTNVSS